MNAAGVFETFLILAIKKLGPEQATRRQMQNTYARIFGYAPDVAQTNRALKGLAHKRWVTRDQSGPKNRRTFYYSVTDEGFDAALVTYSELRDMVVHFGETVK